MSAVEFPVTWDENGFEVSGVRYDDPKDSLLCTVAHPGVPGGGITVVFANSEDAAPKGMNIPMYEHSLIIFENSRPTVRLDFEKHQSVAVVAPITSGEDRVWAGQVRHFFAFGSSLSRIDPDVDHARHFALQSFVYGQSVERLGWVAGTEIVPVASFWDNLIRAAFFTDGGRAVLWLSGEPFSLADITALDWDDVPDSNK